MITVAIMILSPSYSPPRKEMLGLQMTMVMVKDVEIDDALITETKVPAKERFRGVCSLEMSFYRKGDLCHE